MYKLNILIMMRIFIFLLIQFFGINKILLFSQNEQAIQVNIFTFDSYTLVNIDSVGVDLIFQDVLIDQFYTDEDGYIEISIPITGTPTEGHINDGFYIGNVFPNPFDSEITIELTIPHDQVVQFVVYNATGQIVAYEEKSLTKGFYHLNLSMGKLPTGVYFVKLIGTEAKSVKVFKANSEPHASEPFITIGMANRGHGGLQPKKDSATEYVLRAFKERYDTLELFVQTLEHLNLKFPMERNNQVVFYVLNEENEETEITLKIAGDEIETKAQSSDTVILKSGFYTITDDDLIYDLNFLVEIDSRDTTFIFHLNDISAEMFPVDSLKSLAMAFYTGLMESNFPDKELMDILDLFAPAYHSDTDAEYIDDALDRDELLFVDFQLSALMQAYDNGIMIPLDDFIFSLEDFGIVTLGPDEVVTKEFLDNQVTSIFGKDSIVDEEMLLALIMHLGRERLILLEHEFVDELWGDDWLDPLQFMLLTYGFLFVDELEDEKGFYGNNQNSYSFGEKTLAQSRRRIPGNLGATVRVKKPKPYGEAIKGSVCVSTIMLSYLFMVKGEPVEIYRRWPENPEARDYISDITAALFFDFVPGGPAQVYLLEKACGFDIPPYGSEGGADKPIRWTVEDEIRDHGQITESENVTNSSGVASAKFHSFDEQVAPEFRTGLTNVATGVVRARARNLVPGWGALEAASRLFRQEVGDDAVRLNVRYYEKDAFVETSIGRAEGTFWKSWYEPGEALISAGVGRQQTFVEMHIPENLTNFDQEPDCGLLVDGFEIALVDEHIAVANAQNQFAEMKARFETSADSTESVVQFSGIADAFGNDEIDQTTFWASADMLGIINFDIWNPRLDTIYVLLEWDIFGSIEGEEDLAQWITDIFYRKASCEGTMDDWDFLISTDNEFPHSGKGSMPLMITEKQLQLQLMVDVTALANAWHPIQDEPAKHSKATIDGIIKVTILEVVF
jgi:hypothetical protein